MADRYLLESGSPDGYLLESGAGVLLLDFTPAASTLTDNFDDNSTDPVKWVSAGFYEAETTGGTVSETNQRLEVTGVGSASRAAGYVSANSVDLTNDAIFVKISNTATFSADQVAYLAFGPNNNSYYMFIVWPGGPNLLIGRRRVSGTNTDPVSITYSATTHAWLRIRHQASDNTIHFETAPSSASDPPLAGDWTDQGSETFTSSFAVNNGSAAIGSATFTSDPSPGTAYLDGFNAATTAGAAAYTLTADTGAFALSGQAMTPAVTMPAATGSFALTGNALTPAVTMAAARGTFVLTGNAVTPAVALPAATGTFSLTGTAATLTHGYSLVAARGTFTLTGNATALEVGHVFTVATGAFVLTGRAMTPAVAMAAATGTFSITGTATALAVTMPAATGVFALTGNATGLKVTMGAAAGVFALTGNAAGLNKVGSSTLAATTGTFALTGYAAALARAARLSATTGVFSLTGTNAAFPLTRRLTGLTGAFSLTGNAAVLAARFPAIAAQFVLSGFAAGGAVARRLTADPGSFVITGHDLAFVDFSPNAKTYPLAGIAQAYPGTAAAYPITTPQPYPQSSAQTYPLEGIPQQYPLAS